MVEAEDDQGLKNCCMRSMVSSLSVGGFPKLLYMHVSGSRQRWKVSHSRALISWQAKSVCSLSLSFDWLQLALAKRVSSRIVYQRQAYQQSAPNSITCLPCVRLNVRI